MQRQVVIASPRDSFCSDDVVCRPSQLAGVKPNAAGAPAELSNLEKSMREVMSMVAAGRAALLSPPPLL